MAVEPAEAANQFKTRIINCLSISNMNILNKKYEGIAIIGMAGRFPGANNISEFWSNLCQGVESITFFKDEEIDRSVSPKSINHPNYVKARGILKGADKFDAGFFGINKLEAEIMDPQHRIFLELAWQALENAGYVPDHYDGLIGVFAGMGNNAYLTNNVNAHSDRISAFNAFQTMLANEKDYLATRVSFKLNLSGPSLSIYTACSTSLVTVCQACDSLFGYQCDMALAGGISIFTPQNCGYLYENGMIASKDGHCRPFDAKANGTVFGNGGGIVVLKRLENALEDGDQIYAVIRGTALNNDGADKMSFTAPSIKGQAEVITMAMANAEVDPGSISYVETHGTATNLGDPIEIEALTQALRTGTDKTNFCKIGSVKGNCGHLDAAAGIAGLIKTTLALYHKKIPPSINYDQPNPKIDFAKSPFVVNNLLSEWKTNGGPKRAGVSSFGIGGTNAHVILEESPPLNPIGKSRPSHLILLSARSGEALDTAAKNLKKFIADRPGISIPDLSYTLQVGRKAFSYRGMMVCHDSKDALDKLNGPSPKFFKTRSIAEGSPEVVFMFPGQGAQFVNMGLSLYNYEPVFRRIVDQCAEILSHPLRRDIRDLIYPDAVDHYKAVKNLNKTCFNQPALFIIEYALAKLWEHWGVKPSAMIGHSAGAYVAACLSGVFKLEDALLTVAERGKLMQSKAKEKSISIALPAEAVRKRIKGNLSIAAINGSNLCVVSGPEEDVDRFEDRLLKEGVEYKKLKKSHAFHSNIMDPVVEQFKKWLKSIQLCPPATPIVSDVTGEWITSEQAVDPEYWAKHLTKTVLFSKALKKLREKPDRIFLEVGPGNTAVKLARSHPKRGYRQTAISTLTISTDNHVEWEAVLEAIGHLWLSGVSLDWGKFYENENRRRVPLPTYPFERKSYYLETINADCLVYDHEQFIAQETPEDLILSNSFSTLKSEFIFETETGLKKNCSFSEQLLAEIWQKVIPNIENVNSQDNFFELGGDSLIAVQLFSEVEARTGINLPLTTLISSPTLEKLAWKLESSSTPKLEFLRNKFIARSEKRICLGKEQGQKNEEGISELLHFLVPLQPKGSKPPLFSVHAIGGSVLNYSAFIPYLEQDQPLYGIQARGVDGISAPFPDIETMAQSYINEIRTVQPHGPYCLGGGSMGGMIALEMAQRLLKDGEEIALLIMFDTQGPHTNYNSEFYGRGLLKRRQWYNKTKKNSVGKTIKKVIMWLQLDLRKRNKLIRCELQRMLKKPLDHNLRYWYLEQRHTSILKRYTPQPYKRKITMFRACPTSDKEDYEPEHGWKEIARAGIKVFEFPGEHFSFIEEPAVGKQLNTCLKESHLKIIQN